MKFVEEDVKLKIVNEWLKDCGFTVDDLYFEKSFNIKLGKSVYKVDSEEMRKTASPRLDILVTKNDKNLFIIELKAEDVDISEDDVNQGISYARQLDQIAPFTIITNGKTTKIFDSITKQEVIKKIQIGDFEYNPSLEEDLRIRYEALKDFIGLSEENLSIFSKVQISDKMTNLMGSNSESQEKYIPMLFVQRDRLYEDFEEFLINSDTCFSIVGESGTGKTNAICDLAQRYTSIENNKILPFFYNCTELSKPIWDKLSEDFNLNFSQQNTSENIIKRLSNFSNNQVVIFIDAIDENNRDTFQLELDDFVSILKNNSIKICFTCKDTEYPRFLTNKGNPTTISKNIYNTESSVNKSVSFVLNEFSNEEYKSIKDKYIEEYNLKEIPDELNYDLKNGFLLRIYAELHRDKREFESKNIIEMLRTYLNQKIAKMSSEEIAIKTLKKVGESIWDNSLSKKFERFRFDYVLHDKIEEDRLRNEYLKISCNEVVCPELFEYKILQKNMYDDETYIGFYYTRLRDYIIGFQVLKLDKMSDENFKDIIELLYSSNIGVSILQWYYKFAQKAHKDILDNSYGKRVQDFSEEYIRLLDKYFYNIKKLINPEISDNISIATCTFNFSYFFYPTTTKEEKIKLFKTYEEFENFWKYSNVRTLRGFDIDKLNSPKTLALETLKENVNGIFNTFSRAGFLSSFKTAKSPFNIDKNPIIINERATKYFNEYSEILGFCKRPKKLKKHCFHYTQPNVLPIKIDKILKSLDKFKVKYYLANQDADLPNTVFDFDLSTYGSIYEDKEEAANNFIKEGKIIPELKITKIDEFKQILIKYKEFTDTLAPILPEKDLVEFKPIEIIGPGDERKWGDEFPRYYYSEFKKREYINEFFYKVYNAYIIYIEENISAIKNYFELYSQLPIKITYSISRDNEENDTSRYSEWVTYKIEHVPNQKNKVEIIYSEEKVEFGNWSENIISQAATALSLYETIENKVLCILKDEVKKVVEKIIEEENNNSIYPLQ